MTAIINSMGITEQKNDQLGDSWILDPALQIPPEQIT